MVDGAVLGPEALVLRWFGPDGDDRLLLVNLGTELRLEVAPEPLLAPPAGKCWQVVWSSEDPRYGGGGTPPPESEAYNWRLNGHSAVAMAPADADRRHTPRPAGLGVSRRDVRDMNQANAPERTRTSMSILVEPIVRPCPETEGDDADAERIREWIVTNGLGGYASGTVCGVPTRRYHGLLVAALPTPLGRMMMLDRLNERLGLPDGSFAPIGVEALVGRPIPDVSGRLTEFHLEAGLPVWRYEVGGVTLEKRLLLPHLQNTVYVTYRLIEGDGAGGAARPGAARPAHLAAARPLPLARRPGELAPPRSVPFHGLGRPLRDLGGGDIPPLRMTLVGRDPAFTLDAAQTTQITLPAGGPARLRIDGRPVEPRVLPGRADSGRAHHADRLGRVVGDHARPHSRGGPAGRARATRAARQRGPPRGQGRSRPRRLAGRDRPASTPSSCWPPTSS